MQWFDVGLQEFRWPLGNERGRCTSKGMGSVTIWESTGSLTTVGNIKVSLNEYVLVGLISCIKCDASQSIHQVTPIRR